MTERSTWKVSDDGVATCTDSDEFAEWCEIRGWEISIVSGEVVVDD